MHRELERAIGELRVNHTDKEIARMLSIYSKIVRNVAEEHTDGATGSDIRADHPELAFMDDRQIKGILVQAKAIRHMKGPGAQPERRPTEEYLTGVDIGTLLENDPGWFDRGSEDQRIEVVIAAKRGMSIRELAAMVWICSSGGSAEDIEETMREYLKEKQEKEQGDREKRREELSQKIKGEMERRRRVEDEAWDLIAGGDTEGAVKLLESLDDGIIKDLQKGYWNLWEKERYEKKA